MMLLMRSADVSMRMHPNRVSASSHHPSSVMMESVAASNAVAPAGGCTVFVMLINTLAKPTERAPASHLSFSNSEAGRREKSLVMQIPVRAARMCPRMRLRGWASGDSMVLYSRIAAAPKEAMIMGTCRSSRVGRCR